MIDPALIHVDSCRSHTIVSTISPTNFEQFPNPSLLSDKKDDRIYLPHTHMISCLLQIC